MHRIVVSLVILAICVWAGDRPAWARGFGEVHSGGTVHPSAGGGFSRVPTASRPNVGYRPAEHFSNPAPRATYHVAPRIEARPSVRSERFGSESFSTGVRPTIGRRTNVVSESDRFSRTNVGRTNVMAGNARSFNINNHWEHWQAHDAHNAWYHGNWHGNWDNHWHSNWNHWWDNPWSVQPALWGVSGWLLGSSVYDWGYIPYYNPYAGQPFTLGSAVIDYGQPLEEPESTANAADANQPQVPDDALQRSDRARQAFYDQNYPQALSEAEQALAGAPGDPALHEFRALVLFAMGRYREAAAAVHSILAVGPGWDWTTMIGLYPSVDVYTKQLRSLEIYRRDNPSAADARFLLAYHYLTCGHTPAAELELREVVQLTPQDRVAAQLLLMVSAPAGAQGQSDAARPAPDEPGDSTAVQQPDALPASLLVGTWIARREQGSTIELTLTPDSRFTWTVQGDRPRSFSGTSTVTNNLLVLQQPNGQALVGRITALEGRGFRFQLAGGPPNDPGLAFVP